MTLPQETVTALRTLDLGLFDVGPGKRRILCPGFLITTNAGRRILFDTGFPPAYATDERAAAAADGLDRFGRLVDFTAAQTAEGALALLGLRVSDISHVILSHSHIEQHLLGISREQIGAWLMRFWDMPEELATALRFQHDPDYDGDHAPYPNLVCLAVSLLRSRGIGAGPQVEISPALLERLGLTRAKADEALHKVLDRKSVV